MHVITLLLGAILFLPNYASALEERLQSEHKFEPLKIFKNLKRSTRASKPLAYLGIFLGIFGAVFYITSSTLSPFLSPDIAKPIIVLILIWGALITGHLRAIELATGNAPEPFTINTIFSATHLTRNHAIQKSFKDMSYIAALVVSVITVSKFQILLALLDW